MKRLLLIRHGQSVWNAQGRWQGQADPPLSTLGRQQAQGAVAALRHFEFSAVATSALERARVTGETIAEGLELPVPAIEPLLNERSAGEWSGLTKAEIEVAYPGFLASGQRPSGYEPDEDLLPRVTSGLHAVADRFDADEIAVVAHGGVIYVLEESMGLGFAHISNLGARWVHVDNGTLSLGDRVTLLDTDQITTPDQI